MIVGHWPTARRCTWTSTPPRPTAIVVINRIKPHTGFRGAIESGLIKMLSIGIGKIIGAATYHTHGMDRFPELLPQIRDVDHRQPQSCCSASAWSRTPPTRPRWSRSCRPSSSPRASRELQAMAKEFMPQLCFDEIDVLIIDEMGKNISGAGFDPNITGRNRRSSSGRPSRW